MILKLLMKTPLNLLVIQQNEVQLIFIPLKHRLVVGVSVLGVLEVLWRAVSLTWNNNSGTITKFPMTETVTALVAAVGSSMATNNHSYMLVSQQLMI